MREKVRGIRRKLACRGFPVLFHIRRPAAARGRGASSSWHGGVKRVQHPRPARASSQRSLWLFLHTATSRSERTRSVIELAWRSKAYTTIPPGASLLAEESVAFPAYGDQPQRDVAKRNRAGMAERRFPAAGAQSGEAVEAVAEQPEVTRQMQM